jgi:hypothetical protein
VQAWLRTGAIANVKDRDAAIIDVTIFLFICDSSLKTGTYIKKRPP